MPRVYYGVSALARLIGWEGHHSGLGDSSVPVQIINCFYDLPKHTLPRTLLWRSIPIIGTDSSTVTAGRLSLRGSPKQQRCGKSERHYEPRIRSNLPHLSSVYGAGPRKDSKNSCRHKTNVRAGLHPDRLQSLSDKEHTRWPNTDNRKLSWFDRGR
jgi:hypothetical protein